MLVFLSFVVLFIWIIVIQNKVDRLETSISFLSKQLERLKPEENPADTVITPEEPEMIQEPAAQDVQAPESEIIKEEPEENPAVKISEKGNFDIQNAFLGNIFNKIGALAIIIAAVIFIKLVSPFVVITPAVKMLLGFVSGLGLTFGGLYLNEKDKFKNYSEVLIGTGFGVLFIITFCGYAMFHILNSAVVIALGAVLLVSIYLLADKMKTLSLLVIGLVGGYLTPIFSGASYEVCLWYLIFLNMISLAYTLRNPRYSAVNIINLFITMISFSPYVIEPARPLYPLVLWAVYIIYDVLRDKNSYHCTVCAWVNYFVLTFFTLIMFHNVHTQLGYMLAAASFIYAGLSLISRRAKNELYKNYEYSILINLWLFVLFILNDVQSVVIWALAALIITCFVKDYKLNYLTKFANFYYFTAFVGALLAQDGGESCMLAQYIPVWNLRTLIFAVPVLSMYLSSKIYKSEGKNNIADYLIFGAVSLGYIYLLAEINSWLAVNAESGFVTFNKLMIFIILGFIYTLQTKRLYFASKSTVFNLASCVIGCFTLLCLFAMSYDYPQGYLPVLNFRFAAYFAAIASSLFLAKWEKFDIYKYLAVFLGFLLVHSESSSIPYLYGSVWQYVISLSWVIYSGAVTIWGILSNKRYLINSGIVIIILTIFRIFIYDLANVDMLYKLIAFLALGVILMLVSYIYTYGKKGK